MSWAVKFRDELNGVSSWIIEELDGLIAQISATFEVEHDENGHHKNITGWSLTLTKDSITGKTGIIIAGGSITSGGSGTFSGTGTFGGNVIGNDVEIGAIADIAAGAAGFTGSGIDIGRTNTANRYKLISGPSIPSGGAGVDGLAWVDSRAGAPVGKTPMVLFFETVSNQYHLSPEAVTNGTAGSTLGDIFQAANGGRWAAIYVSKINFTGPEIQNGYITAAITSNQNNYNPTGLSTARILRLSTDISRNVTGLVAQTGGTRLTIINHGGADLVLTHADAASTAANRFRCPGDVNFTLNLRDSVDIWYDETDSVWRVLGY